VRTLGIDSSSAKSDRINEKIHGNIGETNARIQDKGSRIVFTK
jgi:hypothetical protein